MFSLRSPNFNTHSGGDLWVGLVFTSSPPMYGKIHLTDCTVVLIQQSLHLSNET